MAQSKMDRLPRVPFVFSVFQIGVEPVNYHVQHSLQSILSSKYNILYINIDSLKNKLDDLELLLHGLRDSNRRKIEIYIIAMTNIKIDEETTKFANLPDYNSFFSTNTMDESAVEGGVALFIHKSLTSGVIANLEGNRINCLVANIPKLKINVGVLYKHPTATTAELINYYNTILKNNQSMILVGNVNINLLSSSVATRQYTNAVEDRQFSILNKIDLAHTTVPNEQAIVDHALSNVKKFKYCVSLCNESISKHKIMVLGWDDNKPTKVEFVAEPDLISYQRINYRTFNNHFHRNRLQGIRGIDDLVAHLIDCKRKSIETWQRPRQNCERPWIDQHSLSKSQRLKMRGQAYAEKINGTHEDRLWDTITEILKNKSSSKDSIDAIQSRTRNIVTNKHEIANIFNDYFINIGIRLSKRIPVMNDCQIPWPDFNEYSIELIETNPNEVLNKIQAMKKSNNIHDSIPSNILIHLSDILAPMLAQFFNNCFRTGRFPSSLKTDRIVPAFKSKDPLLPKNYRPISIPHNISKIIESIICDRITAFCNDHNIVAKNQYGFQKNSSAMSAVVSVVDYLQVNLHKNRGWIGAGPFIDLKKASNTIHHDRLMSKLWLIGIRGALYHLIKNYLHERRQFVDLDNVSSDVKVNHNAFSIPQGSALGPLFFLLYINDIFKLKLHGEIVLFADDTAIVYVEPNREILQQKMRRDLKILNQWFGVNSLSLNTDKTKGMLFKADGNVEPPNLKIRNRSIEFVSSHKYLGIYLKNDLQWDVHINKIVREIYAACGASKRIGQQVKRHIFKSMYEQLIYNRLSKMAAVYGTFATEQQLRKLQAAQNEAVKIFYANAECENCKNLSQIYACHGLMTVRQMINYDMGVLIYKWQNRFLKLNRPFYGISSPNILSVGAKYFFNLDPELRNTQTANEFKANLRCMLTH